jgi:GNAT superfamily N-acetyltransferase
MRAIMNDDVFIKKGFQISTDKSLLNIEVIYKYLNEDSYWAQGIPFERLTRAIENSFCFGVYSEQALAGFARVVTDKASFAYICDVFILPEFRGAGLSKWLIQTIVEHPELQGLRRWSLATSDAHGLYSQFGFSQITKPEVWMEIFKPYQPVKKEGN